MRAIQTWLGQQRTRWLIALLVVTGLASTVLQFAAGDEDWVTSVQTGLLLVFLVGAFAIVSGRMTPESRKRLAFTVLPALGAVGLGIILPDLFRLFLGIALGWLIAAQLLLRPTENREYKNAIKAMRRKDYREAIEQMGHLIKREPKVGDHYAFRAQLYRLNGNSRRAQVDYEKVIQLDPESSVGANGLAEVYLQRGELESAREWGEKAYHAAPQEWVAVYNLGMIAERQHDHAAAVRYLNEALALKMPDSRHRLLTYLWLARTHFRQDDLETANAMVDKLRKEKQGLNQWKVIFESDEAASLRNLLQPDIRAASALFAGKSLSYAFDAEG